MFFLPKYLIHLFIFVLLMILSPCSNYGQTDYMEKNTLNTILSISHTYSLPKAIPVLTQEEAEKANDEAIKEKRKAERQKAFLVLRFFIILVPLFSWLLFLRLFIKNRFTVAVNKNKIDWSVYKETLFPLFYRHRNFILYCFIGCTGAGLDFVLYSILVAFTEIDYQIANAISCSCGIINNFFLNYYFNFKTQNRFFLRLLSFYCVGLVGMGISSLMLYLLIELFDINKILAKILTIFVVTIVQYVLNKFISFRKVGK